MPRYVHRRTGQHPFGGGQTGFCPNGFGGNPYSVGGGVVAECSAPDRFGGGGGSGKKKQTLNSCYSDMYCVLPE